MRVSGHILFYLCVVVFAQRLLGQENCRVHSITIDRREIFDTVGTATAWFERATNSLHSTTNESVVRRELLFSEGELVSSEIFDETERNLRRLGFVGDVVVERKVISDSTVDVRVITHDKWTTSANASVKSEGGVTDIGFSVSEDNFLGNGTASVPDITEGPIDKIQTDLSYV